MCPVYGLGVLAALVSVVLELLCQSVLNALVSKDNPNYIILLAFLVVSAVALTALRPLTRKYLTPAITATNIDSVIGSVGIVTGDIDNISAAGQIKLIGMERSARSSSGEAIKTGTKVRVDKIEGVKAFVSPAEVPAKV